MPQDIVEFYGTEEVMRRVVAAGGEIYDADYYPTSPTQWTEIRGIEGVRFRVVRQTTWEELLAWHQEHFPEWSALQDWEQIRLGFPHAAVFRGD